MSIQKNFNAAIINSSVWTSFKNRNGEAIKRNI